MSGETAALTTGGGRYGAPATAWKMPGSSMGYPGLGANVGISVIGVAVLYLLGIGSFGIYELVYSTGFPHYTNAATWKWISLAGTIVSAFWCMSYWTKGKDEPHPFYAAVVCLGATVEATTVFWLLDNDNIPGSTLAYVTRFNQALVGILISFAVVVTYIMATAIAYHGGVMGSVKSPFALLKTVAGHFTTKGAVGRLGFPVASDDPTFPELRALSTVGSGEAVPCLACEIGYNNGSVDVVHEAVQLCSAHPGCRARQFGWCNVTGHANEGERQRHAMAIGQLVVSGRLVA